MNNFKKWECVICGFIYEEEKGLPDEGINPGTKWEDVPEDFECPECGISKFDFDLIE
jgi:rubredoxin